MKYINLEKAGFVIFEESQKHSNIAKKFPKDTVLSAGFVIFTDIESHLKVYGESISLGKKCDPDDESSLCDKITETY